MTKSRKRPLELWHLISIAITLLYLLFLIVPMFNILKESVYENGRFTLKYFIQFFSEPYYFNTILNSFKISIATTLFSLLVGVPLAYLYNLYRIHGRSVVQVLIILSSMSAP
ncbi:MAG TPA: iron ABC transporter permease, partial [Clostridiales bacterium]|nr:iron ABC transporter permease [Clostridiales bacterium]